MAGNKYKQFGKLAEDAFFADRNMSLNELHQILEDKGYKVHINTLKRWYMKYSWEDRRAKTDLSFAKILTKINQLADKPDFSSQDAFAISSLLDKAISLEEMLSGRNSQDIKIESDISSHESLKLLQKGYIAKMAKEKASANLKVYAGIVKDITSILQMQTEYKNQIRTKVATELLEKLSDYAAKNSLQQLKELVSNIDDVAEFIGEASE